MDIRCRWGLIMRDRYYLSVLIFHSGLERRQGGPGKKKNARKRRQGGITRRENTKERERERERERDP